MPASTGVRLRNLASQHWPLTRRSCGDLLRKQFPASMKTDS
jgi:hypothetical protein